MAEPEKSAEREAGRIDRRLLEILVCPVTKTSLVYDEARQELISRAASLASGSRVSSRSSTDFRSSALM